MASLKMPCKTGQRNGSCRLASHLAKTISVPGATTEHPTPFFHLPLGDSCLLRDEPWKMKVVKMVNLGVADPTAAARDAGTKTALSRAGG